MIDMKIKNKFPENFFSKSRAEVPNRKTEIMPIYWSDKVTSKGKIPVVKLLDKSNKAR